MFARELLPEEGSLTIESGTKVRITLRNGSFTNTIKAVLVHEGNHMYIVHNDMHFQGMRPKHHLGHQYGWMVGTVGVGFFRNAVSGKKISELDLDSKVLRCFKMKVVR